MLLFSKEKKHHDFMEKSKHSEVTHNEKGRISTEATKITWGGHSEEIPREQEKFKKKMQ